MNERRSSSGLIGVSSHGTQSTSVRNGRKPPPMSAW